MTRRTGFIVLAIALFVSVLGAGLAGWNMIGPAQAQAGGAPAAHAGYDRTVSPGDMVVLDGTQSTDPDGGKLTLSWSFVSVPAGSTAALSNPAHIKPTFIANQPGDYLIQLVASDGTNSSAPDTVTISTDNSAPVARAGRDRAVQIGQTVEFDGSGSWDVDGESLTYSWTLVSAPAENTAVISDPNAVRSTIGPIVEGDYVVELVVGDGARTSDPATVTISTGNIAPVADAGNDLRDETAIIPDGYRSSDANGDALSYSWSIAWGPGSLADGTSRRPTMSCAPAAGEVCVAQVIASDGVAPGQSDTMIVFPDSANAPPTANAGPDQAVNAGDAVSLDATASYDVNGDPLDFRWALISMPTGSLATISDPSGLRPTFTADLPGSYVAQLIVNDSAEDSVPDTVVISSGNLPPVANAGADQLDTSRGPTIQLNGAGSWDPNGDVLTYRWSLTELPARSNAVLSDPGAASPTFVADKTGVYMAQLLVSDGMAESVADTVIVTNESRISAYNNVRPVASAGADQSGVPLDSIVQLDGGGTTNLDGGILNYRWALTTKPADSTATISNVFAVAPTFVADKGGLYVAQLLALDVFLYSDPADTVVIKTLNRPPLANAGLDQSRLVGETVALDGTGSIDPDGDALNYSWTLTDKPTGSAASLSGGITATPSFVPDYDGDYIFTLIVDDGEFASAPDSVTVTASNQPPVLGAIGPQTVDLGSKLTIQLTATDPNPGTVLAFSASPLPLPANAGLDATTGLFTFRPDETQAGAYNLTFSVTDGLLTDSESVSITVNAAPVGGVTAISGRVLDTNDFVAGVVPLTAVQGATISVIDAPAITTVTDAAGYFTLSGIPAGLQVLDLDTSTVVNAPFDVAYAGFREEITIIADVTNEIDRPLYLPRIEADSLTTVDENIETVVTNSRLGVELRVPPFSAVNPDGSYFRGQLSISEVPDALAPASLPELLKPGLLVTIQPVGVAFLEPASITFPNSDNMPVGKYAELWSLDAASGAFSVVGTQEVTADGTQLVTVEGSGGIRATDWHFPAPKPPISLDDVPEVEKPCGCDAETGSATSLHTGNLKETHSLVGYSSAGQGHSLQFVYNSSAANPQPIVKSDIAVPGTTSWGVLPDKVSTSISVAGVQRGSEQFTSTSRFAPDADEAMRVAVQFDASDLETGIYGYRETLMSYIGSTGSGASRAGNVLVNNERNSPFGAGWSVAGLNRLHVNGPKILLSDGTGGLLGYRPEAGGLFESPALHGSMVYPTTHTVDDFNGDKKLDIAILDGYLDQVHTLLGDGLGGYTTSNVTDSFVVISNVGTIAQWITTGDFNEDDIRDLVVTTDDIGVESYVFVLQGNGDGTFQAPLKIESMLQTRSAVVADFDGDNNEDIATAAYGGDVRIMFGDGLGGFPSARWLSLLTSAGSGALMDIIAPDLNKDLSPDIVVRTRGTIHTIFNDGTGAFGARTKYAVTGDNRWVALPVTAAADLNGDNNVDIVTGRQLGGVSVLMSDGVGGFSSNFDYVAPIGAISMALGDINHDDFLDVALSGAGGNYVGVMLGDGTGGFVAESKYPVAASGITRSVRLVDLDIDGNLDASVVDERNDGVYIMRGTTPGLVRYISPDSDYSSLIKNPDGTFTRTLRSGTEYRFDADGYQTSVTDLTGRTTSYAYDTSNRIWKITDAANLVTTFNYVGDRLDNVVDPASRVTQFQHDTAGNLIKITDPDNTFRQFDYDAHHRLASQTDKRGFSTTYEFDSFGRHERSVWPDNSERLVSAVQTAGLIDPSSGFGTSALPAPAVRPTEATGSFRDGNDNKEIRKTNRFGFITEQRWGVVNEGTPEETEARKSSPTGTRTTS